MRRLRIGCCAEIDDPKWRWIADRLEASGHEWTFYSTAPRGLAERRIRTPRLARYRACRELAAAASKLDLIVTHQPLITCWTETFRRQGGRGCPHLAFAFNFTRLPHGWRRFLMRRAFARVDRFTVFSQFERRLYSEHFGIPDRKIDVIHWGVREPAAAPRSQAESQPAPGAEGFICAVGSQGRDYATLVEAMRRLPQTRLVLVAHPENLDGLDLPPNVTVRQSISRAEAEAVIRDSRFLVLPLWHSQVPCGHVTMVTAMFLSRAIIATSSAGITDYVTAGQNGLVVPPVDPGALASAIEKLWSDPEAAVRLGRNGRQFALANCTEERTVGYVRDVLARLQADGRI